MQRSAVPALLLLCSLAWAWTGRANSTLLLHDASQRHLRVAEGQQQATMSQEAAAATMSAVLGLVPPYAVAQGLRQVEELVNGDVFTRPRAALMLNMVGADAVALQHVQKALGSGGSTWRVDVADGDAVGAVQAVCHMAAANPEVPVHVLDHTSLLGCKHACLEVHMSEAAQHVGGAYSRGMAGALSGVLQLPEGAALNLSQPAHRLFGIELSGAFGAAEQALAQLQARQANGGQQQQQHEEEEGQGRSAQQLPVQEDVHLFEATFVGLQALQQAQEAPAAGAAAAKALSALLSHLKQRLDAAYDGDVVYHVALLGDAPVAADAPAAHLMGWKEASRRSLLHSADIGAAPFAGLKGLGADPTPAGPEQVKAFSRKATAFGAFLVLLYFCGAALYCMVSMPFKQDTLLYGSRKAD